MESGLKIINITKDFTTFMKFVLVHKFIIVMITIVIVIS